MVTPSWSTHPQVHTTGHIKCTLPVTTFGSCSDRFLVLRPRGSSPPCILGTTFGKVPIWDQSYRLLKPLLLRLSGYSKGYFWVDTLACLSSQFSFSDMSSSNSLSFHFLARRPRRPATVQCSSVSFCARKPCGKASQCVYLPPC